MRIILNSVHAIRGNWSLLATGIFREGVHLVSGDTGSGKSTLALILAGFFLAKSGSIERDGISTSMVSLQFPEYHITGLSVCEECTSWGLDPRGVLTSAGISGKGDISPFSLSRGELKRLHLACVLSKQYDLLLLDEPFSSLDCREKENLCAQLTRNHHGITVIFTHEQSIFPRINYLWEIHGGELIYLGGPQDALERWRHAPLVIKNLIARGKVPENISPADIVEAGCRI